MGYKRLKEDADANKFLFRVIALSVVLFLLLTFTIFSLIVPPESWKYHFGKPDVPKRNKGELRIHYLDVGEGDCTIIELPDGKVMLIDGGDGTNDTKKSVMRYLNKLKVNEIDYLVITHADRDHLGALQEVLTYKKVLNAYLPHANASKNVEYAEIYAAILEEKCSMVFSSRKEDLSKKDADAPYTLAFLYPYSSAALGYEEEDSNDTSAVIWLDYMGTSALFLGDVSSKIENKLVTNHRLGLTPKADLSSTEILKVAHHGSAESTSKELLDYINVETAILSYGKENLYQHPSSEVMERLAVANANVYQTAINGHIMVTVKPNGTYAVQAIEK